MDVCWLNEESLQERAADVQERGGQKKRKAEQVTEKSTACHYKTGM